VAPEHDGADVGVVAASYVGDCLAADGAAPDTAKHDYVWVLVREPVAPAPAPADPAVAALLDEFKDVFTPLAKLPLEGPVWHTVQTEPGA
jgi:hypothetical protein